MNVNLTPGDRIKRTDLHERYGGRRQGGISPSRVSRNVFLVTAPEGRAYGYVYDGYGEDGFFHYTGEGQLGDQQMTQGNRAIRDHVEEGRELHLFDAYGTELEYAGQFRYHDDYQADAPEIGTGQLRKVIVFRLEQLTGEATGPRRTRLERFGHQPVKEIAVEQLLTERMVIEGDREPYEAERREQQLVRALSDFLESQGHAVVRLQLQPTDEAAPLFCDLYDKTTLAIFEAKGTVTRPAIRMALGQLADYARFLDPMTRRVILVPEPPRPDLIRLAQSQNVEVVWREPQSSTFGGTVWPLPPPQRTLASV
jgi:hypothetical protein